MFAQPRPGAVMTDESVEWRHCWASLSLLSSPLSSGVTLWGQPPSQSGLASACHPPPHWSTGRRLGCDWLVGGRAPSVCRMVAMCGGQQGGGELTNHTSTPGQTQSVIIILTNIISLNTNLLLNITVSE